jgi:hypothetical protein
VAIVRDPKNTVAENKTKQKKKGGKDEQNRKVKSRIAHTCSPDHFLYRTPFFANHMKWILTPTQSLFGLFQQMHFSSRLVVVSNKQTKE